MNNNPKSGIARVLVVDDHPVFREGLRRLFDEEGDLEVCGEAGDKKTALSLLRSSRPDVALIDITLKDGDGLDLIKDLRKFCPHLPVLIVSMHDEVLYAGRALRAGANGYVMKEEAREKIVAAVRQILGGAPFFSDRFRDHAVSWLGCPNKAEQISPVAVLTNREMEVFALIGKGCTTHEIAEKLAVSPKTIEGHRVNIKTKLRIRNVTELVRQASHWVELEHIPDR